MRVLVIVLLVFMLLCSTAFAFERDVQLAADGRVDIHSVVYNGHLWTGLDVYGDGILNYVGTSRVTLNSLDNSYDLEMGASLGTLTPIRAITATGGVGNYALKAAPDAGEVARLSIRYEHDAPLPDFGSRGLEIPEPGASIFTFSELTISSMVQMSKGDFRSHVSLDSPVIGAGVREDVRIRGEVYFQDMVSFDQLNEVEIRMPE